MIFIEFLIFLASLAGLFYGARFVTDGASGIAKAAGISEFVIGATIVAIGTSLPELASTITAMQTGSGHPGIVMGNVLGSNLANIGLAIGLVAIFYPMPLYRTSAYNDVIIVIGSGMTLFASSIDLEISPLEGMMMIGLYLAYIYNNIHTNIPAPSRTGPERGGSFQALSMVLLMAGGGLVYASSDLIVSSLLAISTSTGIGEEVVAFFLLAVGTSIPEMTTSLVAARKKMGNIAMGNIFGSIAFNNLVITGTASFLGEFSIHYELISQVLLAMIFCILLLGLIAINDRIITRLEGIMLLAVYILISLNVMLAGG